MTVVAVQKGGLEASTRSCVCPGWRFQRAVWGGPFPVKLLSQKWVHVLNEGGFEE